MIIMRIMAKLQNGAWKFANLSERKCKIITILALVGYTLGTIYAVQSLWPNSREGENDSFHINATHSLSASLRLDVDVEIWGKAAVSLYFWEHILQGPLQDKLGGVWQYGEKYLRPFRFKFRTGPGVVPGKVPPWTKNLVLVLNGREPKKITFAKAWLDSLRNLNDLKNVAVVLLGNERCDNDWLMEYMVKNGGMVNLAFIVYDISNRDDDVFYQWPLGVATYRRFPNVPPITVEVEKRRKYICNFLGTFYSNSSRVVLKRILDVYGLYKDCLVRYRETWLPNESTKSAKLYYDALANSDLTLCPVGVNTECYRIYEACSFGSVPVIEDVMTPGHCGKGGGASPLHILKKYKAPFIFITDWAQLPKIIEKERLMSTYELADRRKMILNWYNKFKEELRLHFVKVLMKNFGN